MKIFNELDPYEIILKCGKEARQFHLVPIDRQLHTKCKVRAMGLFLQQGRENGPGSEDGQAKPNMGRADKGASETDCIVPNSFLCSSERHPVSCNAPMPPETSPWSALGVHPELVNTRL